MTTSPHNNAKGVVCETRYEPLPSPASLHGCRINTKSKKNVFTHTSGRQKRCLTVLAFLLYEQYNNNFIFKCTNELEYENFLAKKGGCTN